MITREDVAALRVGDVVELSMPGIGAGVTVTVRGPVVDWPRGLAVGGLSLGADDKRTLTVIAPAKHRPYVNSDKAEPGPGDVVRNADADDVETWARYYDKWVAVLDGAWVSADSLPDRLRLLVDGTTGMTVP